jgi:hypothetical protein
MALFLICSRRNIERSPRRGKRSTTASPDPSGFLGEGLHISAIATRGDAAHVICLHKANQSMRDGMKNIEDDPASRPHEDNPRSTRADIKNAGPARGCLCGSWRAGAAHGLPEIVDFWIFASRVAAQRLNKGDRFEIPPAESSLASCYHAGVVPRAQDREFCRLAPPRLCQNQSPSA